MSVAKKRISLESYTDHKGRFTGIFVRKGMMTKWYRGNRRVAKYSWLIVDVRDEFGQVVAEHLWIRQPAQARWLQPHAGDQVICEGFSMIYHKKGGETDWCLRRVQGIQIVPQNCRHVSR